MTAQRLGEAWGAVISQGMYLGMRLQTIEKREQKIDANYLDEPGRPSALIETREGLRLLRDSASSSFN